MFQRETVIVIGAGASNPYGYPLGINLIDNIIHDIERDIIFLPHINNQNYSYTERNGLVVNKEITNPYYFTDFKEKLAPFQLTHFSKQLNEIMPIPFSSNYIYDAIIGNVVPIRLNCLKEFYELKTALLYDNPSSIDNFLRLNPSFAELGKTMIIYSLLKFEKKDKFNHKYEVKSGQCPDHWYRDLFNDITQGCHMIEDILNNKLKIITFNYDLSLEYFLITRLCRIEKFKSEQSEKIILEWVKNTVHHVYGQLYTEDIANTYHKFSANIDTFEMNTMRFLQANRSINHIKLIEPERVPSHIQEKIQRLINKAAEIMIIGFGFDADNILMLGLETQEIKKLVDKQVKFKILSYKGEKNSLFKEYEKALGQELFARGIIRSSADRINDAYINEFKSYPLEKN